jgi:putative endonuclease
MLAYFYILFSGSANQYYVGHTTEEVEERLRKHNSNHDGYTAKYRDWRVVYTEVYPTKDLAYNREREVKKWKSRKRIELLIRRSEHPA